MTKNTKKVIADCFNILGLDVDKDADLARGYFLISLVNACFGDKTPVYVDVTNVKFLRLLRLFHVSFFSELSSFSNEKNMTVARLIEVFREERLFENHRVFFDAFSPFIVEWESFSECFLEDHGLKAKMFAVLAIILAQDDSMRKQYDIYSQFDPVTDILAEQFEFTEEWLSALGLSQEDFFKCFNSIFCRPIIKLPVKNNGNIEYAIKQYRKYYVPLTVLLEDYYLIKTHSNSLEKAVNPWAYVHKGIRKIPVEVGVSVSETLFEFAAYPLKDELPTDVIRSVFYSKSVSDSDFECSFLLPELLKKVRQDSNVLIIHPSPDMILKWNEYSDEIGVRTIYAVPNTIMSELYQMEFPDKTFIPFEQINNLNGMDCVLLTPRNIPSDLMQDILDSFAVCSQEAVVIGLFPNTLFDMNEYNVHKRLLENQFKLKQMLLVSSKVVASSPRKKVLMYLERSSNEEADATIPTWYLSNWADDTYYISKEHFAVSADDFFQSGVSIKSLMSQAIQRKKCGENPNKAETRNTAERYRFSAEITIQYTINTNRKNRFAGKAYYCSCAIPEKSNRKRGKRLTDMIEAGLRAKSEAEVVQNLEWIPFDERVYPHIVEDITENYQGQLESLSLKTIWFCLRLQLQKNKKYDEELCVSIFCGDKQDLSVLIGGQAPLAEYVEALGRILAPESKAEQLKYWVQLDLIFKCALSNGYVRFNPIAEQVSEISSQATEEQREVRNALTKKTFSFTEGERMLAYITAETSVMSKNGPLRRYEKDSIWLAGAIKMFTGLSTREVCALLWEDIVKIPGTDVYQFIIKKYVDDKGNVLSYGPEDGGKKIRKVPVVPMLAMLLQHRYQYLADAIDPKKIQKEPVVLRSENRKGNLFARPRYVTEKLHVLLKQAEIPEQLLILPDTYGGKETDMNRYFGDVFLSNFRYQANHTCFLTRGELNYVLGVEPPDTFAKHYCDYGSDLIQYIIANKLQRWSTITPALAKMWYCNGRSTDSSEIVVNPNVGENATLDLIVESGSDCLTNVEIEIDCELGFACRLIRLEKGNCNEKEY